MGFSNPPVPWSELERTLSGRARPGGPREAPAASGDGPAGPGHRRAYVPPPALAGGAGSRPEPAGPAYAELHCRSNFSFLDGASHPEELVEEAARLGLRALALTDRDGLYGVVRLAEAAAAVGMPTVFGADLALVDVPAPPGFPDRPGRVVVLARGPAGYARLSRAVSEGQMAGERGAPRLSLAALAALGGAGTAGAGSWVVLTGGADGAVPAALAAAGPAAARRELDRLVEAFGAGNVRVELWDHGDPVDAARNDALVALAGATGTDLVATNDVRCATPARHRLATALAALRLRRSLDDHEPWLPAGATAHLRSGAEQERRFARFPGVVAAAGALGQELAFALDLVAPALPPFACPPGPDGRRPTEMAHLRALVEEGGRHRYGPRRAERVPGAWAQLDRELAVIEDLGYPGYFLVVADIVRFCRERDIYCQGRGSAANSAVCYALGITSVDAVTLGLLFERFLSSERDGPPDIDVDIESGRREEVIQYVYATHGREHTAQVANVVSYRSRSAVRDMARALGHAPGQGDGWAKQVGRGGSRPDDPDIPAAVLALADQVRGAPRHLSIHSGGMVICDRPVVEVCPVEWARMPGRSILQWDKDDCAAVGLVKFDLLGLGMLSALHRSVDAVEAWSGERVDLAALPQDPEVYAMLSRADSLGVFQVESRAQMATLPRLQPRTFDDLVAEVALIRPGPIQGGSVHPYIRRRNGQEEVTYPHPLCERALRQTFGVPLFQEQLMHLAIDVAGFTPTEADQLRQAMGSKRSHRRMAHLRARFVTGAGERGVSPAVADELWDKLAAFADYGFPQSHAVSFAYLVYASAWLKRYQPAAFCAGLLDAQPMGFYSPHSLVRDARRHGVPVRRPDVNASAAGATLEVDCVDPAGPRTHPGARPDQWGVGGPAVRLGLAAVRHVGPELAGHIATERAARPYADAEDLARRSGAPLAALEALATAGALDGLGPPRRAALWAVGAVAQSRSGRLPGIVTGARAPALPGMSPAEEAAADLWATGISADGHPTVFVRAELAGPKQVVTAADLATVPVPDPARPPRVTVAGVVTHRQRPPTAGGTVFVTLEDETGLANVVVSRGCWARHRRVATSAPALLVRGRLERAEGVVNVIAERIEALDLVAPARSRDFR